MSNATLPARKRKTVKRDPNFLDSLDFIIAVENHDVSQDQFDASAQPFVDSGVWRHLQGSWQRTVLEWVNRGMVSL